MCYYYYYYVKPASLAYVVLLSPPHPSGPFTEVSTTSDMWTSAILFVLAAAIQAYGANGGPPVGKVYGVNVSSANNHSYITLQVSFFQLGSWLLIVPWMLPNEWIRMGGETCYRTGSCTDCAASEFDLVKKIGQQRADEVFQQHWETWFSESDVRDIVDAGLNTVRIPVSTY